MNNKLIGPALYQVKSRWVELDDYQGKTGEEWLYAWIKNSQGVIKEGMPYAVSLYGEYNKSIMNTFPQLSTEDIDAILAYTDYGEIQDVTIVDGPPVEKNAEDPYTTYFLVALVALLLIVMLILIRVTSVLNKLSLEKEGLPVPPSVPIWKNRKLRVAFGLIAIIFLGNFVVNNAIDSGRQETYAPAQPIKFSHELHAGINGVECQYCHNSASKSKHSNIPSANICMNCHKAINGDGAKFAKNGRKEISKIYAAIGFDPNNRAYFDDYENMNRDTVAAIFSKWLEEDGAVDHSNADVEEVLAQIQEPIEWVRIHNLPDHVYFNHSQHVAVAGLECQECHGPVETMEVMRQHSALSMGWCISCHREKEVNFASNDYYQIYDKYHEELKKGEISKVTVEMIGGTQCQKCHY